MATRTTFSVPADVRDILKQCPLVAVGPQWHLTITAQLERKMYEAVNKVLAAAGGKWNRGLKVHVFATNPAEVLLGAVETGTVVDEKKVLQAYYTPPELARRVVQAVDIARGMSILEPSCGMGALATAIRETSGEWPDCVDIDPKAVAHMVHLGATSVWENDFLAWAAKHSVYLYDRIVMNPPFSNEQDMVHVSEAIQLLKPGGKLVAIMSPAWRFHQSNTARTFRKHVGDHGDWFEHEEGTFATSGTHVRTGHFVFRRPL